MASSRQLVSECKACSTLLTFLRNLKLNFPHKDTSRRCWLCVVRLDDPLSQNEADHFADHKKNAFKCIRLHWEHHLKKQDYKNRYKIKLLRLTFCTAVLSFFFVCFFHSHRPIPPPAPSVLRSCFLPPSLHSSIRPLHRSHRRIILFNMVSGRRHLSWQIHYWLALTRTYSLLPARTHIHTHTHTNSAEEKIETIGLEVEERSWRGEDMLCLCCEKCVFKETVSGMLPHCRSCFQCCLICMFVLGKIQKVWAWWVGFKPQSLAVIMPHSALKSPLKNINKDSLWSVFFPSHCLYIRLSSILTFFSFYSQDGQSRTVRQFQFTDWPEQGVPKSGEGFIDFIGQVHKTKEQFGQDGPISVHCR